MWCNRRPTLACALCVCPPACLRLNSYRLETLRGGTVNKSALLNLSKRPQPQASATKGNAKGKKQPAKGGSQPKANLFALLEDE